MKDLNTIVRSNDNRYFRTPDNSISFPLNLDELDYMTPIDLEHGRYAERVEYRKYSECDYPDINTLIEQGKLIECRYSEEYEVNTDKFPRRCPYKRVIEEFKANGFNVTREAINTIMRLGQLIVRVGIGMRKIIISYLLLVGTIHYRLLQPDLMNIWIGKKPMEQKICGKYFKKYPWVCVRHIC